MAVSTASLEPHPTTDQIDPFLHASDPAYKKCTLRQHAASSILCAHLGGVAAALLSVQHSLHSPGRWSCCPAQCTAFSALTRKVELPPCSAALPVQSIPSMQHSQCSAFSALTWKVELPPCSAAFSGSQPVSSNAAPPLSTLGTGPSCFLSPLGACGCAACISTREIHVHCLWLPCWTLVAVQPAHNALAHGLWLLCWALVAVQPAYNALAHGLRLLCWVFVAVQPAHNARVHGLWLLCRALVAVQPAHNARAHGLRLLCWALATLEP
eukprot:1148221-Pelagomonas_calceolata.AAC.2